ncbi:MAG: hypothetical protein IPH12_09160 [Saprospirales bacterium]|nr:hypothetical protein [Saprospirales bacterium]MBK8921002.1 hypothetical protein [Saprospirales bacterium]
MKILISSSQTIAAVQEAFQEAYPYLKLVFFTKPHRAFKGSPAKYLVQDREQKLGDIIKPLKEGALYLEPEMPTWQVERLFEEEFGLHVQVFRKSGNTWLETSVTDDLSLEQQNAKGKASEHIHFEFIDPIDYREQE